TPRCAWPWTRRRDRAWNGAPRVAEQYCLAPSVPIGHAVGHCGGAVDRDRRLAHGRGAREAAGLLLHESRLPREDGAVRVDPHPRALADDDAHTVAPV